MITRSAQTVHTNSINIQQKNTQSWQEILSQAVTKPDELLKILGLSTDLLPGAIAGSEQFQMRVPHTYIARMERGNPDDPLLRQVLPLGIELDEVPGFSVDPLGEQPKNSHRGILHKYHGRLLLIPGQLCGVNCRFCFRRHFPYADNKLNKDEWQSAFDYIRNDSSLTEIILSGGDPLSQNDQRLRWVVEELSQIPHLKRLRIHTRMPIVIPQRITDEMIDWLTATHLQPIVVVHCNHPDEIDNNVVHALNKLRSSNVQLLNQSTLLKGVNNSADVLAELSEKLFNNGVMPYYLHLLDRVQGAAHFEISEQEAQTIMGKMSQLCAGYLVPRLARESAGEYSKTVIPPIY
ncbi:EF-P beta-lysylation protein EpmB [Sansalvadorimonas verongulae]|uniref:EF-P beta-lysylation protein EpmB n=1 Tax=Sansalvadorimonas verongulae TaxID=2172824 RepID=UPI0012BB6C06|nr:EF-P beta-lysylation protein EpmB [Sansalvadorimonas verongulae]MTI13204.1 EF-P beta-lysylation protein EpmB [Sansalvadorimonas verongulae]